MLLPINLDLLSVGIAVAGTCILGFAVYLSNRKSLTNKVFLIFSITAAVWGVSNYLNYQFNSTEFILWTLRMHLFITVWYCFSLFTLFYVFPNPEVKFTKNYKWILIPIVILVSALTLTSLAFSRISEIAPPGQVTNPERGPGILLFVLIVLFLVGGGIILLIKRMSRASGLEKNQFQFVLAGTIITFSFYITFNMILPIFFNQLGFIPFGSIFTLPLVVLTGYAIMRYHLLNVKVIATEILTFLLVVITFSEVVISKNLTEIVFRSMMFVLLLGFGILLIRSVRREVEQREQLQELTVKLQAANVKLEELSHFKTQLLSLASHQVKAPLAAIKGFTTILSQGLYGPVNEKVKETLGKIQRSADALIQLVSELLDLRKVEEGKMDFQFKPTKAKELVAEVFETLQPLAAEKKLQFVLSSTSEATLSADPQKLKQVFSNLAENAIKYTPAGVVKVELKDEGQSVLFSVADTGLGISPELVSHLFEEFQRDPKVKEKIRGTGLGLFIAKKIIEAHGGQIWAESGGDGKGSKFIVKLPRLPQ